MLLASLLFRNFVRYYFISMKIKREKQRKIIRIGARGSIYDLKIELIMESCHLV